jgi:hypothetical protein
VSPRGAAESRWRSRGGFQLPASPIPTLRRRLVSASAAARDRGPVAGRACRVYPAGCGCAATAGSDLRRSCVLAQQRGRAFLPVNEMEPGNEGRAPVQLNASRTRARRREHRHPVSLLQLRMSRNYNGGVPRGSFLFLSEGPRQRRRGSWRLATGYLRTETRNC